MAHHAEKWECQPLDAIQSFPACLTKQHVLCEEKQITGCVTPVHKQTYLYKDKKIETQTVGHSQKWNNMTLATLFLGVVLA